MAKAIPWEHTDCALVDQLLSYGWDKDPTKCGLEKREGLAYYQTKIGVHDDVGKAWWQGQEPQA